MRNNNRGFTLLEILIALFIFSIVSMIMVGALHTVFNSQATTDKHAEALTRLQIAVLLMSHDFEQMVNRPITNAKNMVDPPFVGTPDTVTFTHMGLANPLGMMQRSTMQRTAYSLSNEHLIRSTWPVLDQTQKTLPSNRILLHDVTALRFDYLDEKRQFQKSWPPSDRQQSIFPRGVRVSIVLKKEGTLTQLYLLPQQMEKPPQQQTPSQRPTENSPAMGSQQGSPS